MKAAFSGFAQEKSCFFLPLFSFHHFKRGFFIVGGDFFEAAKNQPLENSKSSKERFSLCSRECHLLFVNDLFKP